jgi:cytidylate kinase
VGVVTISRQYGAGGLRVAPLVTEALGFRLVDREIAEEAARRLGVDPQVAQGYDERAPAIVEELGMALAAGTPAFGGGPVAPFDEVALSGRSLAEAVRRVIESLAEAGGYVILGRGAQAALRGRSDAVHASLVGELRDRVRRIAASQGVDEKEAAARCDRLDSERAGYVRHYHGVDIRDPLLYDVVLNTSRMSLEDAAGVIVGVARRRLGLRDA